MMPGRPNNKISLQLKPALKKSIFQMLPNQWIMPTKKRVWGRGRNSDRAGTIMVEVPNPVVVPRKDAKRVRRIRGSNAMLIC